MKHILCMLGLHRKSKWVVLRGIRRRGKHTYRVQYACCDRCYKKMGRVTWPKEAKR